MENGITGHTLIRAAGANPVEIADISACLATGLLIHVKSLSGVAITQHHAVVATDDATPTWAEFIAGNYDHAWEFRANELVDRIISTPANCVCGKLAFISSSGNNQLMADIDHEFGDGLGTVAAT